MGYSHTPCQSQGERPRPRVISMEWRSNQLGFPFDRAYPAWSALLAGAGRPPHATPKGTRWPVPGPCWEGPPEGCGVSRPRRPNGHGPRFLCSLLSEKRGSEADDRANRHAGAVSVLRIPAPDGWPLPDGLAGAVERPSEAHPRAGLSKRPAFPHPRGGRKAAERIPQPLDRQHPLC